MHVHVFAIDILPSDNLVCSGGGLRSWQFVSGLQKLGAEVTYSIPLGTSLVRQQWEQITAEQRENCFSNGLDADRSRRPIELINKFKPDVTLVLWPSAVPSMRNIKRGMITAFDINGFQNVKSTLIQTTHPTKAQIFREETDKFLRKISCADILITGSSEQRAYWGGLLGYHLNSMIATEMIDVPFSLDNTVIQSATTRPYYSDGPIFFCVGTFLPWNSPKGHIIKTARMIAEAGHGQLLVVGRPNLGMSYSDELIREFDEVSRFRFVRFEAGLPLPRMVETLARRGVAIDLHLPTFERQFALPVRTITYLALGTPVVFNNYSTLAAQMHRYGAGFCIDPANDQEFESVIGKILSEKSDSTLTRMSDAAVRLVEENYDDRECMGRLFALMQDKLAKARTPRNQRLEAHEDQKYGSSSPFVRKPKLPRVLVISDDVANMQQVRVHLPFRAMQQEQLIGDYILLSHGQLIKPDGFGDRMRDVDVVWVQRRPENAPLFAPNMFGERLILDIDDNLLISPAYRPPFSHEWTSIARMLLRCAGTVTVTSPRLADTLQRHSGVTIEHKIVIAPNMTGNVHPKNIDSPSALLLSCSDYLPLTASKGAFLAAIKRFTELRGLPLLYLGTPQNDFSGIAKKIQALGTLPYERYLHVLRSEPVIGVVPLEAHGDPVTDDFVCSKSDIKMVEFGAASVPAVYSRVAPYLDSPLQAGPMADFSDTSAVIDCLDKVFNDANRQARLACDSVREQRLASVVVPQWHEAIERERLSRPVSLELIQTQAKRYGRYLGGIILHRPSLMRRTTLQPTRTRWIGLKPPDNASMITTYDSATKKGVVGTSRILASV